MQSFTCHTNEDAGRLAAETASLLKLLPPGVEVAPLDLADLAAAIRPDGPRFLIFQGPTYSAETLGKAVLCKRLGVSFEEIANAEPFFYPIEKRLAIIDRGFGFFDDPSVLESAELIRLGVRETIVNPKFGIAGEDHATARVFDCSRVVIVVTVPEGYRWDRLDCHPDLAEWLPVVRVIRLVREGAARNLGEPPRPGGSPGVLSWTEERARRFAEFLGEPPALQPGQRIVVDPAVDQLIVALEGMRSAVEHAEGATDEDTQRLLDAMSVAMRVLGRVGHLCQDYQMPSFWARVRRLWDEGGGSLPAEPGERFLCDDPAARYGLPLLAGMTLCKEPREGGRPFWVLRGDDDGETILRVPGEFSERQAAVAASVALEHGSNRYLSGYREGRAAERHAITYGFKAVFEDFLQRQG
jgi:hypothetical protein